MVLVVELKAEAMEGGEAQGPQLYQEGSEVGCGAAPLLMCGGKSLPGLASYPVSPPMSYVILGKPLKFPELYHPPRRMAIVCSVL